MYVAECGNYNQWYDAVTHMGSDHVVSLITDRILFPESGYDVDWGTNSFQCLGISAKAHLDFSQVVWNGDYAQTANGMRVGCKDFILAGCEVSGHQAIGDCIKGTASRFFAVFGCHFRDIASVWQPYRPGVAAGSITIDDSVYGQCIGGHQSGTGAIMVSMGNHFRNCCTNNAHWGHCNYTSGGFVLEAMNHYDGCGNPISIGNGTSGQFGLGYGSTVTNPALCQSPYGPIRPPLLAGQNYMDCYFYNHFSGLFGMLATSMASSRLKCDFNDFTNATFNGATGAPTAFAAIDAAYKTFAQWQQMGFDVHSRGVPVNVTRA